MKIFKGNYVRLDDDVSFQIVRTNPKLTTNTKVMYDGESLYLEAYPAEPILTTLDYKHRQVWKNGLFNRDIRNFLLGSDVSAYSVGREADDTTILDNFDNQFETMYWCGVESINSDFYPQEMGCIAPLYLRKKRPNYFVVFKLDTPANTNFVDNGDTTFEFDKDVKDRMKIVKAFDLREGTPIGDYIKKYVEQREFKYDQSIYVNFSSNEIYYYGIDRNTGVLTQKVENFEEQLLNNDNTIMKMDDWITSGFERNNLIFPYIINFEFLFDDDDIEEYKFARYFGMYCNDIDLYDLEVTGCSYNDTLKTTSVYTSWERENIIYLTDSKTNYIKGKNNDIYTLESTYVPGNYNIPGKVDEKNLTGFEASSSSAYMEKFPGVGNATMIFTVTNQFDAGDQIKLFNTIYNGPDDSDSDSDSDELIDGFVETIETLGIFTATNQYGPGEFYENKFSCAGTIEDTAKAIAGVIKNYNTNEFRWITAFNIGDNVVLKSMYPGTSLNNLFDVLYVGPTTGTKKIKKLTEKFEGGTDIDGCIFKIYTSDKDMFVDNSEQDRDTVRYIKCGSGRDNAEILTIMPYINENKEIDDTYSLLITDDNGPYVNITNTNFTEIVDRFYPKVGILSFFPVKDFDFDTLASAYGECRMMNNEIDQIDAEIYVDEDDADGSDVKIYNIHPENLPQGRFFVNSNEAVDTEYEYFFENILPELTTENKTVPTITKWGYMDDSKDSCENPYRLNTSKIFEACNFSANTFMQSGDILEYTHSMPYYINNNNHNTDDGGDTDYTNEYKYNEYQYIEVDPDLWNSTVVDIDDYNAYELIVNNWKNYFLNQNEDKFDEMFGDTSNTKYRSKRFNKKYSRFFLGSDVTKSTTLFRGVKFEITELKDGKEVSTGKYNGYKFSCIYVPYNFVNDESELNKRGRKTIHFVKNDKFKFIVCIVMFDINDKLSGNEQTNRDFNKAYVYAGSMGYIELGETDETND